VETTPGLAALCLGEGVDAAANAFANKSVIVYKKFAQSDRLWDGSDIDIEERLDAAREAIGKPRPRCSVRFGRLFANRYPGVDTTVSADFYPLGRSPGG
jgi:hypothetical protein